MDTTTLELSHRCTGCRRFLRGSLVAAAAVAVGWAYLESRRVERLERIGPQLTSAGLSVLLEEPTAVGQLVRKFLPEREPWLAAQFGAGWFGRPTVLVADDVTDARVPLVAGMLSDLGTTREVHLRGTRPSQAGISALEKALPGVRIASADDRETQTYFRGRVETPQFAFGGAMLAALFAVIVPALVLLTGWCAVRSCLPRRAAV